MLANRELYKTLCKYDILVYYVLLFISRVNKVVIVVKIQIISVHLIHSKATQHGMKRGCSDIGSLSPNNLYS